MLKPSARTSHQPNSQATSGRFRDRGVRLGGFTGFLSRVERAATWCPTGSFEKRAIQNLFS